MSKLVVKATAVLIVILIAIAGIVVGFARYLGFFGGTELAPLGFVLCLYSGGVLVVTIEMVAGSIARRRSHAVNASERSLQASTYRFDGPDPEDLS